MGVINPKDMHRLRRFTDVVDHSVGVVEELPEFNLKVRLFVNDSKAAREFCQLKNCGFEFVQPS